MRLEFGTIPWDSKGTHLVVGADFEIEILFTFLANLSKNLYRA